MDRFGDELLASAGLALDEDGGARGCDLGDGVEEAQHGLGFADDVFEVVALLEDALELDDFGLSPVAGDGGADVGEKLLVVPGFLDEVFGAGSDRVDDVADGAEGGDHDDGQVGVHADDAGQKVDAAFPREGEVEQEQVEIRVGEDVEAAGAVGRKGDIEAFEGEESFEGLTDGGLVVDDEESG